LSEVPILILLPVGARLPKSFCGRPLLDRVGRVAAPVERRASSPLEVGELVIGLVRRPVGCAGAVVLLEPAEFELVRVLAERRGRPVTDRQLLRAVCGSELGPGTHRLRVQMARLRAKLERGPSRPTHLFAEPGIGYRLCGPGEVLR
jgi:two-component system KDP operon response regulator KdpE